MSLLVRSLAFLTSCCSVVDGGLDELVDELNSGKILYAGLKVVDPNTNLPKYVLINWVGILFVCKAIKFNLLFSYNCMTPIATLLLQ